jgi:hypothetical protein
VLKNGDWLRTAVEIHDNSGCHEVPVPPFSTHCYEGFTSEFAVLSGLFRTQNFEGLNGRSLVAETSMRITLRFEALDSRIVPSIVRGHEAPSLRGKLDGGIDAARAGGNPGGAGDGLATFNSPTETGYSFMPRSIEASARKRRSSAS